MSRVLIAAGAIAQSYEGTVSKVGFFGLDVAGHPGHDDRKIPYSNILTGDFQPPARGSIKKDDHVRGIVSQSTADRPYYMGEDDAFVICKP